uniref:Rho-associated protein kinase 1 n=1 Tax=Cacopsylla melanoneura TaxID=428564 RepID=A0A8D9E530_9HEMI
METTLLSRIADIHQSISNPRNTVSKDCLLDTLMALYTDCEKGTSKSTAVKQFLDKYKNTVEDIRKKNVSAADFDIKRFIQQGNFGDIYLVKEKQSHNTFVMKKVLREKMSNTVERDIMVKSSCPCIVNLFYSFQDMHHVYFIMEYVSGGDFATLLENQPDGYLSENKARFYIHELVQAVQYLHNLGYVHRDIKPDNMLLSATGHLKLTDFGSATQVDKKGLVTSIVPVGTPEYVAPEVLEWMEGNHGIKGYTASCDLWSIGVVSYELLTGNTPFNYETLDMTYSSILACDTEDNIQFPSNISISSTMKHFVRNLVQKMDVRLSMEQTLGHPVFDCLDEQPPCIPPPSQENKFHKKDKRKASPSLKGFQKENNYLETALPLIGISYSGDASTPALSSEETRNLQRERLQLMQQLSEARLALQSYKREVKETKRSDETVLEKCKQAMERHRSQCSEYDGEIAKLRLLEEKLQDKVSSYKQENSSLVSELKQLKSLMDARETKLKKEARRSKQFTEQQSDSKIDELVVSWKAEVKSKDNKIQELKQSLEKETHARSKAEQLNKELREEVDTLNESKQKVNKLTGELEQCQRDLSCSQSRVKTLTAQVSSMERDVNDTHALLAKKDKEVDAARQEIVKKDNTLVGINAELGQTRQELEEVKSELEEKVKQMEKTDDKKLEASEYTKELDSLRSKVEEEKEAARQWRKDWYQSVKERNSALADLKLAQSENESLKEKVDSLEKQLSSLQEKSDASEKSLVEKLRETEDLTRTIDTLKREMEKYEGQVKDMREMKEKYEKDKKSLQDLKNTKDKLDLSCRGYKVDLSTTRAELDQAKARCIELEADVKRCTRECEGLKEAVAILDKENGETTRRGADKEEELATLRQDNKTLKEDKLDLWHQVKTQEHNLKTLQNSMEDLKRNMSERENKLKTANEIIGEYESKINALESTIGRSESYCKEMVPYLETLQKNNDILSHDNEQLRKERTEYITQLSNACAANESLSKSNSALSHQVTELETTVKSLESFYKQREIRLDTTVNQLFKLCEHQRICYEESLKKKPNLLRKVFGSSQNKEFDSKEMEAMLNQERSRAKDLAEKLYLTKAELDTIMHRKTQRVSIQQNREDNKENVPCNNKTDTRCKMTVSKESIASSNSSEGNLKALTRILNLDNTVNINTAMFLSEQCVVLGTRDGLFSLHLNELGEAKSKPTQIGGVEMVHAITFIHQKHMALLVTGSNRTLHTANLRHLVTAAEMNACASPSLDLSPLFPSAPLTGVNTLAISPCQNILAIAIGSTLVICRWNNVDYDEMCRKDMGGGSIQSVSVVSPHSIVYASERSGFVTFDPTTCRHRAWLSTKEPVVSSPGSRPLCLVNISKHEHLACFNTGALFVDDTGKMTRSEPLYWNYLPVAIVFRKPFLVVFNPSCITIIQINENTLRRRESNSSTQPDDRVIDVKKPKFLGETLCNKNVVLMSHNALQLLNPELVFSAQSLTLSDVTSQDGDELSMSAIDEELKLLEEIQIP